MEAGKLVNRFLRSCGLQPQKEKSRGAEGSPGGSSWSAIEDCLDCPVCWEGMNTGMNSPHVLFCGHTLCRSCLMGLPWATLKFPSLQIQLPLLVSCPWCQFFTLRFYWKGRLRFPSKNFFLLSIVESVKGCSQEPGPDSAGDQEELASSSLAAITKLDSVGRRLGELWHFGFSPEQRRNWRSVVDGFNRGYWGREEVLKLLFLVLQIVAKLPLICMLLYLVLYVLPLSALALVLFCLFTLVFAVPAYLVLYFSYPSLQWLAREIAAA